MALWLQGKAIELMRNFFKDESGVSAVEYSLLLGMIALVILGAVTLFGAAVNSLFSAGVAIFPH